MMRNHPPLWGSSAPGASPTLGLVGTRTAVLDRVDRLGAEELTAKRLRERVLSALREVLAYDAHVWLLTDPVTRVGTSPLADVPGLPWSRLPELGRLRYLTRVNRWTDLMDARRRSALLLEATHGRPELSALWRDCLCSLGVVDVAAMVCYDRFGCWAGSTCGAVRRRRRTRRWTPRSSPTSPRWSRPCCGRPRLARSSMTPRGSTCPGRPSSCSAPTCRCARRPRGRPRRSTG